jgi:hypothetical protein
MRLMDPQTPLNSYSSSSSSALQVLGLALFLLPGVGRGLGALEELVICASPPPCSGACGHVFGPAGRRRWAS